jgi:hypothetical protein
MIKWFCRCKCRKFMRDAFRLSRRFIANCNEKNCKELIDALEELIDDYENKYGVDDISLHYRGRLDYFRTIGGHKVK